MDLQNKNYNGFLEYITNEMNKENSKVKSDDLCKRISQSKLCKNSE